MIAYKYIQKRYLEQFKERGTISIGNIEWYRDIENEKIRDPFEGRTVYSFATGQETIELSMEQTNAITNDYHISASLRIGPNTFFRSDLKVPNAFVFSTSLRLDKKLMKAFGCDSYYKIIDIKQFMETVSEELNKQYPLLFSVAGKVRYVQTKVIKVTNDNKDTVIRITPYNRLKSDRIKQIYIKDYFSKSETFKEEEEFRLIFIPKTPIGKKPVFLTCRKLVDYCEF
jgi:hypothetical protein